MHNNDDAINLPNHYTNNLPQARIFHSLSSRQQASNSVLESNSENHFPSDHKNFFFLVNTVCTIHQRSNKQSNSKSFKNT